MTKHKIPRELWTKSEIKQITKLWETKTTAEIAEMLGRKTNGITYMAKRIRDAGYNLPKKRKIGITLKLITEALEEENLI